ncbi:cyanase [Alicyclobacillus tolerans]|uniref:cyanase n=1 Tax=Alicyclobacillus tolerans TaxID=90970 RepID=UPI001F020FA7|nr:cyanase [Alicyclobacillus tolerans]MCF8564246.1 cyanase [Alicyclobacillus tolerans]
MTRFECTQAVLEAKQRLGLTWQTIAQAVGKSEVWVATALLGQATMTPQEAFQVGQILDLNEEAIRPLTEVPYRGELIQNMPPRDPTLYRLYEILLVYGPAMKEIIHEKFGDGIMSAIDFQVDIDREKNPNGDRVVVTMSGKFLPYKTW